MTDDGQLAPLRLRPLNRHQPLEGTLDQLLPSDDDVRCVDDFVQQLDTSALEARLRARLGTPGAPAFAPKLLVGVLFFGLLRGVYAFRALELLCQQHLAFRWLCGGDAPSYHTLSTFYSLHQPWLEATLVNLLSAVREQDLVTYEDLSVDGRKIRAHAATGSAHRPATATTHYEEAVARVARLRRERDEKLGDWNQQQAAQLRAAEDRQQRVAAALQKIQARNAQRAERDDHTSSETPATPDSETRASETDADASKMKFANGGYHLAYNVQTVTDVGSGLIVVVEVVEQGCDNGLLATLVNQAQTVTGVPAETVLADAGFSSQADVQELEGQGIAVVMPSKNAAKDRRDGRDPYATKRYDTPEVRRWRARLGEPYYQGLYRRRAAVSEGVHAQQHNRGFYRFRLRGLAKVRTETLWQALVHNFCVLQRHNWLAPEKGCPLSL